MDLSALRIAPSQRFTASELKKIWELKMLNMKQAWEHFNRRDIYLKSLPFKAIVELTQNCNFRCIMCTQSWDEQFKKYKPDYNMSMETFIKIADQLFPAATFIDLRGFGETTILPHWPEVVDYLERFPYIQWHLVTNLSLPRDDTWEKMIKLDFALGFSCDGATKSTFETIRTRSHFETIRHNLGVIRDSIRKHNRGWIYFISTIQKKNVHELRAIVELAHEFEVPEVQFKIVQEGLHSEGIREMDPLAIQKYAEEAVDAALALGVRITFNDWLFTKGISPEKVQKAATQAMKQKTIVDPIHSMAMLEEHTDEDIEVVKQIEVEKKKLWEDNRMEMLIADMKDTSRVSVHKRCFKPFSFTYVNYKAEMGTCNHMMYPDMLVMGDLTKDTLRDTWNSDKYLDFRRQLITEQPKDARCQWCFKHRLDD